MHADGAEGLPAPFVEPFELSSGPRVAFERAERRLADFRASVNTQNAKREKYGRGDVEEHEGLGGDVDDGALRASDLSTEPLEDEDAGSGAGWYHGKGGVQDRARMTD